MVSDHTSSAVNEFRSSQGHLGGAHEGKPILLLHHRGRRSGLEYVNPLAYLRDEADPEVVYVFAARKGAPRHPDWYCNLVAQATTVVEIGSETYRVGVKEIVGADRDRIYAIQAHRNPNFVEHERRTAGIRVIPVVALRRIVD